MSQALRLMCSFAHPDDETLGMGATVARYASEGVQVSLLSATRGERGWQGSPETNPGLDALGVIRERELRNAARVLGAHEVVFLDYLDGDLDQAEPREAIAKLVSHIRRIRPHVLVTFGRDGTYGHPDHIAISQLTHAAAVCAADGSYADPRALPAHRVPKFYYLVDSANFVALVKEHFGTISMTIDGVERSHLAWPEWQVSTRIDVAPFWPTMIQALMCHESQLPSVGNLPTLPDDLQRQLWGIATFYRAYSLVNGGRVVEDDLFAGLRESSD